MYKRIQQFLNIVAMLSLISAAQLLFGAVCSHLVVPKSDLATILLNASLVVVGLAFVMKVTEIAMDNMKGHQ